MSAVFQAESKRVEEKAIFREHSEECLAHISKRAVSCASVMGALDVAVTSAPKAGRASISTCETTAFDSESTMRNTENATKNAKNAAKNSLLEARNAVAMNEMAMDFD